MAKNIFLVGLLSILAAEVNAQSSMTVYGRLDAGVTIVSDEGGARNVKLDDGVTAGNRIGFKGVEDLGEGNKALFVLENGFEVGTGATQQGGAMFGRQAYVGLQTKWGTVSLGNQYTALTDFAAKYNISSFASGYAFHQGDFDRLVRDRLQNSIKYLSPEMRGFRYSAIYGFGERAGDFRANSSWGLGGQYENGPFSTAIAYTRLNNPRGAIADPYQSSGVKTFLGQKVATVNAITGTVTDLYAATPFSIGSQSTLMAGAQYRFGAWTLAGDVSDVGFKGFGRTSSMRTYEIGGSYAWTPALEMVAGFQHSRFEQARWNQLSAGLNYSLSKRTTVYLSGDYLKASAGVNAVIGGGFAPSSSNQQANIRVGTWHKF